MASALGGLRNVQSRSKGNWERHEEKRRKPPLTGRKTLRTERESPLARREAAGVGRNAVRAGRGEAAQVPPPAGPGRDIRRRDIKSDIRRKEGTLL